MSTLIVEVCEVQKVQHHPNADKLDIIQIKGWDIVTKRDEYKINSKCVFIPPDTIIPEELAKKLAIDKYLQPLPKGPDGIRPTGGRIRVANLRSMKSFGLVIPCEDTEWPIGYSVVDHYGFSKYDPPLSCTDGDAEKPHHAFFKYTDLEHYANFPSTLVDGEEVIFTEKLHGKNARLGIIQAPDANGNESFIFMVGSHGVRRKESATYTRTKRDPHTKEPLLDENNEIIKETVTTECQFWKCLTEDIKILLKAVCENKNNVIIYGEMIGVQDMTYGKILEFRAFDIMVNGQYLDYDNKKAIFEKYKVPMVPILYKGPFDKEILSKHIDGPTTMCKPEEAGPFKGREGIVITPIKERFDKKLPGSGRVILKAVSFDYLNRKTGTEDH